MVTAPQGSYSLSLLRAEVSALCAFAFTLSPVHAGGVYSSALGFQLHLESPVCLPITGWPVFFILRSVVNNM